MGTYSFSTFLHMPEKLTPRIVWFRCSVTGWTVLRWPPSGDQAQETTGAGVPALQAERSPSRSATFAPPSAASSLEWGHRLAA